MKSIKRKQLERIRWYCALLGPCVAASTLSAADTNAPQASVPPLTPEQMFEGGTNAYNGWVELSSGGFITSGNKAQAQQQRQTTKGAFGGIEDFHYQGDVSKGTTFSVDGRSMFGNDDYKLSLDLRKEKTGYLRFSISQYRTWYNGDGGFFPPSGTYYPLSGGALGLDRGEISFEGGLTLENKPQVTFKYTHSTRDGEKGSTSWGLTHPIGGAITRGLSPSFYDINEHNDSFALDVTHTIKKTDFGVGVRYDTGKTDDALKITQFPGEPIQQKITDRQGTSYDMFNVHAFTETWLKKNLMFSTGYSYSYLDNDFSGSRIYGSDFDIGYVPNAQNGTGYINLDGGSRMHEYVTDLNLFYQPTPHIAIVPSVRVLKEDTDADVSALETVGTSPATPFSVNSDTGSLDVRERLDMRYNGITNWVFYARGELTEGTGNVNQYGGLVPINGIGVPPVQQQTDDRRFFQKYSIGARWYPARKVTIDTGGYYKINRYNYDNVVDSTPNTPGSGNAYPGFLVKQDFETYDGNVRLTLRPLQNLTLISRYEYQLSTIHTTPDSISGLSDVESSKMNTHIIGEDVSWSPLSRLYFQAGLSYVLSTTKTPASEVTQSILDSQNNYWTMNFTSGLVLNDKTDLKLGYFYYKAADYNDNSAFGVPYGSGAEEHGVTATLTRRISQNLRWILKYGFYHYNDESFGGFRNYNAHTIYSSLQYRF